MIVYKVPLLLLLFIQSSSTLPLQAIASYDHEYEDEESENELIQLSNLQEIKSFSENEKKYNPLHLYVKSDNQREIVKKVQVTDMLAESQLIMEDKARFVPEDQPFVGGYKQILDDLNWRLDKSSILKRELSIDSSTVDDDLLYDYEALKAEYDQQLKNAIQENKIFNYTKNKESEFFSRESFKNILDIEQLENCTNCASKINNFLHDYSRVKDKTTFKKLFFRIWVVVKVWIYIYVCLAIPCWCQKGWCCCCFRCKMCFPKKRITQSKQYYVDNPPGILKKANAFPIKYVPTEFENNAFEELEAAIKNL